MKKLSVLIYDIVKKISKDAIMQYFYPDVSVETMKEKLVINKWLKKWDNNGIISP